MELLYMYIPDNGMGIKDLEFNFSPNYHFSLNREERKFYMTRKEVLPHNWFGHNILNVTAIVGKNGTGKTNLIKALIDSLCYQSKCIQFYIHNNKIYTNYPIQQDKDEKHKYYFDFEVTKDPTWASPLSQDKYMEDSHVIYYSSAIDRQMRQSDRDLSYFKDISNGCLLRHQREREIIVIHDEKSQYFRISDVDEMLLRDIQQQLIFFQYVDKAKILPIDLKTPEWLIITLRRPYVLAPKGHTFTKLTEDCDKNTFAGKLKYYLLYQIFSLNQSEEWAKDAKSIDDVFKLLDHHYTGTNLYQKLISLYSKQSISYKYQQSDKAIEFKVKVSAIDYDFIEQLFKYYYLYQNPYASLQYEALSQGFANDLVKINWGMSSGERNFLALLSRIYCAILNISGGEVHVPAEHKNYLVKRQKGSSWLLILDEPDISLHPEWQRKFLNLLLKTLGGLFPDYVFQIIITTHSPILLSDIPKSNTILLDKENDKCKVELAKNETFGANIYSLYNDSFFLKGIPIGEFAKNKLKNIETILNNKGQKIDDSVIEDIYRIGEPVIKNYFLKLLDKRRQSMSRTDRLQSLYNEIQRAEEDDKA